MSTLANPKYVNWDLFNKEKAGDAFKRWIKKHPEDEVYLKEFLEAEKRDEEIKMRSKAIGAPLVAIVPEQQKVEEIKIVNEEIKHPPPSDPAMSRIPTPTTTSNFTWEFNTSVLNQTADQATLPVEDDEEEFKEGAVRIESPILRSDVPPTPAASEYQPSESKIDLKSLKEELSQLMKDEVQTSISSILKDVAVGIQGTLNQELKNQIEPLRNELKLMQQERELFMQLQQEQQQEQHEHKRVQERTEVKQMNQVEPSCKCPHCSRHGIANGVEQEEVNPEDPYHEDIEREWNINARKYAAEGFTLPKNFNLRRLRKFDKQVLQQRRLALLAEEDFVRDHEALAITIAQAAEKCSNFFGLGGNAIKGLGKRIARLVNKEHALERQFRRMYHEQKSHPSSSPGLSLLTPLLSAVLDTVSRNETKHVASAVGSIISDAKEIITNGEGAEKTKRKVSRKANSLGMTLLKNIITFDEEEEDDSTDEQLSKKQNYYLDSDEENQEILERRYNRTGTSKKNFETEDPDEFLKKAKQHLAQRAYSSKAKKLIAQVQIEDEKKDIPFQFKKPKPGEQPRVTAPPKNVTHEILSKAMGSDGIVQGFVDGYAETQICDARTEKRKKEKLSVLDEEYCE